MVFSSCTHFGAVGELWLGSNTAASLEHKTTKQLLLWGDKAVAHIHSFPGPDGTEKFEINYFPFSLAAYLLSPSLNCTRMEKDHQLNSGMSHFDAPLIFSPRYVQSLTSLAVEVSSSLFKL